MIVTMKSRRILTYNLMTMFYFLAISSLLQIPMYEYHKNTSVLRSVKNWHSSLLVLPVFLNLIFPCVSVEFLHIPVVITIRVACSVGMCWYFVNWIFNFKIRLFAHWTSETNIYNTCYIDMFTCNKSIIPLHNN